MVVDPIDTILVPVHHGEAEFNDINGWYLRRYHTNMSTPPRQSRGSLTHMATPPPGSHISTRLEGVQ